MFSDAHNHVGTSTTRGHVIHVASLYVTKFTNGEVKLTF